MMVQSPAISDPMRRVLVRLGDPRACVALTRDGCGFGVFATGDQRRRPRTVVPRGVVVGLVDAGLMRLTGRGLYRLTAAGLAAMQAMRRLGSPAPAERFAE